MALRPSSSMPPTWGGAGHDDDRPHADDHRLAADSALAGGSNPRWPRRMASVVTMAVGAAVAVVLLKSSLALPLGIYAVVACACAMTAHHWDRGRPAANV